jgi:hypothetical protein
MRKVLFVAAMFLCVFLTQRTRAAALPECPSNVLSSCVMTHDHSGSVAVFANNVTVDCQGHAVTGMAGAATSPGTGISVNGFTGVRIKNCVASGWDTGIGVDNVPGAVFLNDNVVVNNKNEGYAVNRTTTVYIKGGTVMSNKDDGIDLLDDVFVSISAVSILNNVDKGITHKNTSSASNIRFNAIENRITRNGMGISVQAPAAKGYICGNGFWMNTKNLNPDYPYGVFYADNLSQDKPATCSLD